MEFGQEISLTTALVAGVVSFLSPCVLPLVPGYISFISGVSLDQLKGRPAPDGQSDDEGDDALAKFNPRRAWVASFFFVLGFSTVFITLGAAATGLGALLGSYKMYLARVAGVIIIVFGLHLMGVIRIPFLYRDARFDTSKVGPGAFGAFVIGLAFAFGWTPCTGPILAGIYSLALTQDTLGQGVLLLTVYSAGLGLPFLAVGFAMRYVLGLLDSIKRHLRTVELVSGGLLVAIGLIMALGKFTMFNRVFSFLNDFAL